MKCSLLKRFESKYIPEPNSGCWLWEGATTCGGYGHIRFKINNKWTMKRAHRVAFELYKGEIPKGLIVRHCCDNRLCVNPNHLLLGTTQDNIDDKMNRGRHNWGTTPGHRKLSFSIANTIREYYATNKLSYKEIALLFNTSASQVHRVLTNKIWRVSAKVG